MRRMVITLLGLGMAPMACAALPQLRCPDPGVPPGGTLTWIAPQIAVDGWPMAILQLNSRLSPQAVLSWYDRRWRGLGPHPDDITYRVGAWKVVARRRDGCFETVQVQAHGGGTQGDVGISRPALAQTGSAGSLGLPLPTGSRTVLTMENADGGRHARNVLAVAPGNPGAVRAYYQHLLPVQGWALQWARRVTGGDALMYQQGARAAEISITRNGIRSNVFLTVVGH